MLFSLLLNSYFYSSKNYTFNFVILFFTFTFYFLYFFKIFLFIFYFYLFFIFIFIFTFYIWHFNFYILHFSFLIIYFLLGIVKTDIDLANSIMQLVGREQFLLTNHYKQKKITDKTKSIFAGEYLFNFFFFEVSVLEIPFWRICFGESVISNYLYIHYWI